MNIREHIEAGHYPQDEKGRALVPGAIGSRFDGDVFVVCGADVADCPYLIGWWRKARMSAAMSDNDGRLLSPPPRKVKVTAWAIVSRGGAILRVRDDPPAGVATGLEALVQLTGEYEEPWT